MQRIGEIAARLFKLLAGQQSDECVSSYVIALYVFLFVAAMTLVFAWVAGGPIGRAA